MLAWGYTLCGTAAPEMKEDSRTPELIKKLLATFSSIAWQPWYLWKNLLESRTTAVCVDPTKQPGHMEQLQRMEDT